LKTIYEFNNITMIPLQKVKINEILMFHAKSQRTQVVMTENEIAKIVDLIKYGIKRIVNNL